MRSYVVYWRVIDKGMIIAGGELPLKANDPLEAEKEMVYRLKEVYPKIGLDNGLDYTVQVDESLGELPVTRMISEFTRFTLDDFNRLSELLKEHRELRYGAAQDKEQE